MKTILQVVERTICRETGILSLDSVSFDPLALLLLLCLFHLFQNSWMSLSSAGQQTLQLKLKKK